MCGQHARRLTDMVNALLSIWTESDIRQRHRKPILSQFAHLRCLDYCADVCGEVHGLVRLRCDFAQK
jgi:hypothetical protein